MPQRRPRPEMLAFSHRKSRKRREGAKVIFAPLIIFSLAAILSLAAGCRRDTKQSLKAAAEAWDSGDYALAAEEYEQFIERYPTDEKSLEARLQLANVYYYNLRRYDQARAHYKAFLDQEPAHTQSAVARERLAEVLAEIGRSYEAIGEYENLNPASIDERRRIRLRIADLYFDQKNFSQALTEYEKVIEGAGYDDMTERACLRQASVYHIARGQYQRALPLYQKLASHTSDPEVRRRAVYGITDCYEGLFQFDDAIKILRAITDEAEQAYITRRMSELERGKREAAEAGRVQGPGAGGQ